MFKLPCPVHDGQGRSSISSMITLSCKYCLLHVDTTSYQMLLPSYHSDPRGIPDHIKSLHPTGSAIVPCPIHLDLCSNVQIVYVYVLTGLSTSYVSQDSEESDLERVHSCSGNSFKPMMM